jgi:IS30 family transposase
MAAHLKSKTAAETAKAIIRALKRLPEGAYKTINFDNGSEFTLHADMEDSLKIAAYFCDPHSPWQRGSIENINGVLRRDLPRKSDITDYSRQDIREITGTVNTTPRKCLGYLSPAETFLQSIKCCT